MRNQQDKSLSSELPAREVAAGGWMFLRWGWWWSGLGLDPLRCGLLRWDDGDAAVGCPIQGHPAFSFPLGLLC